MSKRSAGWEVLVDLSFRQRVKLAAAVVSPALIFLFPAAQLMTIFLADGAPAWAKVLILLGSAVVILGITVFIRARFSDAPYVNFGTRMLRRGRREFSFDEVNVAAIPGAMTADPAGAHFLKFGVDHGPQLRVLLQRGPQGISDASRARLLAVLRDSNIGMPVDPHDPKGKYARYNFPDNVTRDQAIDIVENVPDRRSPHAVT